MEGEERKDMAAVWDEARARRGVLGRGNVPEARRHRGVPFQWDACAGEGRKPAFPCLPTEAGVEGQKRVQHELGRGQASGKGLTPPPYGEIVNAAPRRCLACHLLVANPWPESLPPRAGSECLVGTPSGMLIHGCNPAHAFLVIHAGFLLASKPILWH